MLRWINQLQNLKVSTPEEFDALVQKIEVVAKRNPTHYRSRLRILASLGYAYILTVFILLFAGLWGIRQLLIYTQGYALIDDLNTITWLVALGLLSLFFIRLKPPTGISITREQVPQLFAIIDELSSALKAPKLDQVILNEELNAAILQRPRYGFIGWQTNYLMIGLPLMQALSTDQLKAVIAHELAHLCGDDGRVSAWIYRIRRTWYELAERFESNSRGGFLFKRFFSWYGPFFRAYSFVHARSQEYEADRRAAELVGANHKAEALIGLHINSALLSKQFWPDFLRQSSQLKAPPDNFMSQLLDTLQTGATTEQSQRWLALRLAQQTNNQSTHPCLKDRLEALDYTIPNVLSLPESRAIALLDDQIQPLTENLNQQWQAEESKNWEEIYQLNQHQLNRLNRLQSRADKSLTVEEQIKRAQLTWQLDNDQDVLSIFQTLAKKHPNHTTIRYWVGFLKLEQHNHDSGVTDLQYAIDHDPSLVIPACRRLYSFYLKQDQPNLAAPFKERWQNHEKDWALAQAERVKFDEQTRFTNHDIPPSEIRQLVEHFSTYPEVKTVYLARKVVERFSDHPYYIFGVTRRYYSGMGKDYKSDGELKQYLKSAIAFSSDYSLRFIDESPRWKRLKQLEGALIYTYSGPDSPNSP